MSMCQRKHVGPRAQMMRNERSFILYLQRGRLLYQRAARIKSLFPGRLTCTEKSTSFAYLLVTHVFGCFSTVPREESQQLQV